MSGLVVGVFAGIPARCPRCGHKLGHEKLRGYRAFRCDRRPPLRGPVVRGARTQDIRRCRQPLLLCGFDGVVFVIALQEALYQTVDTTLPLSVTMEQLGLSGAVLQQIGGAS